MILRLYILPSGKRQLQGDNLCIESHIIGDEAFDEVLDDPEHEIMTMPMGDES
jgi:hypothetical protein